MIKGLTITVTVEGATPEMAAEILARLQAKGGIDAGVEAAVDRIKIARQFLKYVRRVPSQLLIVDEISKGNGVLSYENMLAAHAGVGGPSLAGCLSSITKNWQKAGGNGKFFRSELVDGERWIYSIDSEFVEALRQARVEMRATKFTVPLVAS